MKFVVAIDSFKGSITSLEAGDAAKNGILRALPDAEVKIFPVSDGGEGTCDALTRGMGGVKREISVTGPIGKKVTAEYGIVGDTAIIEMASAAGITLLSKEELNPMVTTTYGVGEMIKDAIDSGCRKFIVGIGGSATNDGGIGMLQALGFDILDKDKQPVPYGAEGVDKVCFILDENVIPGLLECEFRVACDVENPLCGSLGCSRIFSPQKGADEEMIVKMDESLLRFSEVVKAYNPISDKDLPGSGAAGGLGFAFLSFLNARLEKGIGLVLQVVGIEKDIKDSDFVITGEGRLDSQSIMGKAPSGVAGIAKKYNKPVLAFAGGVTKDAGVCNENGIDAFFPIVRGVTTLEEAMEKKNASDNLSDAVEQAVRLIKTLY